MDTKLNSASGWRLALAAGALAALTVGCGTEVEAPTNDIGDRAPAPSVIAEPEIAEVPDLGDGRKCAQWPSEARAEKKILCR
ncbi:MAG: hypothetical protein H0X12_06145 [Nocardioides sp.]|nr:hypothetical protein [Nocardioides sp.]